MIINKKRLTILIKESIFKNLHEQATAVQSEQEPKTTSTGTSTADDGEYVDSPPSEKPADSDFKSLDDIEMGIYKSQRTNAQALIDAAKAAGITNKYFMIGLLRVCAKESGIKPKEESRYGKTSLKRVQEINFGARDDISKEQWEALKAHSDAAPFNYLYGGELPDSLKKGPPEWNPDALAAAKKKAAVLGNTQAGDGDKYRGRGFNQITGRSNYEKYKVTDPESLIKDPKAAARVTIEFLINNAKKVSNYGTPELLNRIPNAITGTYIIADATCGKKKCEGGRGDSIRKDRGGQIKFK